MDRRRGRRFRTGATTAFTVATNDLAVDTLGTRGGGTETDQTSLITTVEGETTFSAEELAVGSAVAIVVRSDSVLIRVAVGALSNRAEEEVFGSSGGWDAEGE